MIPNGLMQLPSWNDPNQPQPVQQQQRPPQLPPGMDPRYFAPQQPYQPPAQMPEGLMNQAPYNPQQMQGVDPRSLISPVRFEQSMPRVFQFEGGLNKRDTNGTPSNMGINQAANPDVNVTTLTKPQASDLYRQRYWNPIGGDQLPGPLAHVAFDTSVIAGPGKAKALLAQSGGDPQKFMDLREQFLGGLLARDPEKYGKYEKAWGNRNATLRSDAANWDENKAPTGTVLASAGYSGYGGSDSPREKIASGAAVPEAVKASEGVGVMGDAPEEEKEKITDNKDAMAGLDSMGKALQGSKAPQQPVQMAPMMADGQDQMRSILAQQLMAQLASSSGKFSGGLMGYTPGKRV